MGTLRFMSVGRRAQGMGVSLATLVGRALGGVFYVVGALRTRHKKPCILKGAFVRAWFFGRAVEQEPVFPGLMSLGATVFCCVCRERRGCRNSFQTSWDSR